MQFGKSRAEIPLHPQDFAARPGLGLTAVSARNGRQAGKDAAGAYAGQVLPVRQTGTPPGDKLIVVWRVQYLPGVSIAVRRHNSREIGLAAVYRQKQAVFAEFFSRPPTGPAEVGTKSLILTATQWTATPTAAKITK